MLLAQLLLLLLLLLRSHWEGGVLLLLVVAIKSVVVPIALVTAFPLPFVLIGVVESLIASARSYFVP